MQEDWLITHHGSDDALLAEATAEIDTPIVIPSQQLERIRDRWMRPLVDRIAELEREAGRLEAERDRARAERELAIRERDEASHVLEVVTLERNALLVTRGRLRDRVKELEFKVRSAQDTTALRAIQGYDLPRRRPVKHRRMAFWKQS